MRDSVDDEEDVDNDDDGAIDDKEDVDNDDDGAVDDEEDDDDCGCSKSG